jgi:DNA-binding NtrC family response regulator
MSGWNDDARTATLEHAHDHAARRWLVRVIDGPDRGQSLILSAPVVIGSGEGADWRLADVGISRKHLRLEPTADGIIAEDLGSKNGSFLLGVKLTAVLLGLGAEVRIGRSTLRIDDADEVADLPELASFGGLEAESVAMRRTFGVLARAAKAGVPLLFEGEPGTGKLTLAKAVHASSSRASKPCVVVDASVGTTAVVGELWGAAAKKSAFTLAQGGTLILKEPTGIPLHHQARLARVIEEQRVRREGEKDEALNVRFMAITSRHLDSEVRSGRMRADLRDAFKVGVVTVPPLRDRHRDLHLIVHAMLRQLGRTDPLPDELIARLALQTWPDNLKGLRAVLATMVARSGDGPLELPVADVHPEVQLKARKDDAEKASLIELLARHNGNVSAASRAAGIDRRHLHRLLKKHGLRGGADD